jgi:tryptophanase
MQAAMLRGDEAYSGSRSYYALSNAAKALRKLRHPSRSEVLRSFLDD